MDIKILQTQIDLHKSTYQIAEFTGKSQTTVYYWLRKYGLKTQLKSFKNGFKRGTSIIQPIDSLRICSHCQQPKILNGENFYKNKSAVRFQYLCKSCSNELAQERQRNIKKQSVEFKGGKCKICEYDKCIGALDFHHLNKNEKEFGISTRGGLTFEKLKNELDKCILLCKNCHSELHAGLISLTDN